MRQALHFSTFGLIWFFAGPAVSADAPTSAEPVSDGLNMITFLNQEHPGNRVGYRLHEHLPLVAGAVSSNVDDAGIDAEATERLIESFAARPGVLIHKRPVTEEGWIPQNWTFYFAPVEDGLEILWVVETKDAGLNRFYAAQQCFRMGGVTSAEWRRKIAETPAFSEYDLWARQESAGETLTSLSFYRRGGRWTAVPADRTRMAARTPLGRELEAAAPKLDVLAVLDPGHEGRFIDDVDSGLMTRVSEGRLWLCGLYWEGATHVSNHHSADCLHATVNLGPIPPHAKRAIKGRIYWKKGAKEELYEQWLREFGQEKWLAALAGVYSFHGTPHPEIFLTCRGRKGGSGVLQVIDSPGAHDHSARTH